MTDSIKTTLDLGKLSPIVRKDIDARLCNVSNLWGELKERYVKPTHQVSPMSGTKTKWVIRCARDAGHRKMNLIPTCIDADLNIPNAIVGHNLEHGTSVFAAGVAALELQRIWLAQSGLPRQELDLLTIEDVRLRGVTIAYLDICPTEQDVWKLLDDVKVTGRILHGDKCKSWESGNLTVEISGPGYSVIFYLKTDISHCKWQAGAPVAALLDRKCRIVRIEVKLSLSFLRTRKLLPLESWRNAYERGIYKDIFNATVRKCLRLDDGLRHKAPREEVYARLSPTEARLLRGVVEDGRDPAKFKSIAESNSPAKRRSELRLAILPRAGVDIDIPWKDHARLRCFELADRLIYPGDYQPSPGHAEWCFCHENWPELLLRLKEGYEVALAAAARPATVIPSASRQTFRRREVRPLPLIGCAAGAV